MPRDATATRERILDAAQREVYKKGFAATSVDHIQAAAGISRGTFFYHFPAKDDLARSLLERYAEQDRTMIDGFMERAERLASDPLQQALLFVAFHEEMLGEVSAEEAGCLFASYSYEAGLFDERSHKLIVEALEHFRRVFGDKLADAIERHGTRNPDADPYRLADMFYGTLQGAFILARTLQSGAILAEHAREFRRLLELLFDRSDKTEEVNSTEARAGN
jgi:TetR/AcrR family transcriptional repressor of nem operon